MWSRILSSEEDFDSAPYLFHLYLCVNLILLQSIKRLCNLFYVN